MRRGLDAGLAGLAGAAVASAASLLVGGGWTWAAYGLSMVDAALASCALAALGAASPRLTMGRGWARAVLLASCYVGLAVVAKLLLALPMPLVVRPLGLPRPDGAWLDPAYLALVAVLATALLGARGRRRRRVG